MASSKPGQRHTDPDKAEQHDNHVQRDNRIRRDDGHPRTMRTRKIILNGSASGMRGRSMARRIVDFDTPVTFVAVPSDVYNLVPPLLDATGRNMPSTRLTHGLRS